MKNSSFARRIATADDRPRDVAYTNRVPIETFDFIVTDECHRSIYGLWRQVLEYFDAFLIGLTATPSKQTIGFFNQNFVMGSAAGMRSRPPNRRLARRASARRARQYNHARAVTAPDKVKGRSQAGRFADLVSLVRFALEKQPVLEPFADSVAERFDAWLHQRDAAALNSSPLERGGAERRGVSPGSIAFTPDQLAWLHLMRNHIATSLSLESDDFDFAPFAQRGGLGRAHQLFGAQLPTLLDELNAALVA